MLGSSVVERLTVNQDVAGSIPALAAIHQKSIVHRAVNMGRKVSVTPEQLDQIIDAFSEKSDVGHVTVRTGLSEKLVRDALSSPEAALRAMRRKAAVRSVWLYGSVFDILDDMVNHGDTRDQIQGIKLYREFLKDIPPPAPVLPPDPEPKQIVGVVDEPGVVDAEEVEELPEGVRIEDMILNG